MDAVERILCAAIWYDDGICHDLAPLPFRRVAGRKGFHCIFRRNIMERTIQVNYRRYRQPLFITSLLFPPGGCGILLGVEGR